MIIQLFFYSGFQNYTNPVALVMDRNSFMSLVFVYNFKNRYKIFAESSLLCDAFVLDSAYTGVEGEQVRISGNEHEKFASHRG